jgi:hypothetical protein
MTPRYTLAVLTLGLLAVAGGCGGEDLPKTYPVKGTVVVKHGDVKSLVGGYVRLASAADGKVIGVGEIQDDGSFGIGTFIDGKPRGGLPVGEYRARVEPRGIEQRDPDDAPLPPKRGELLQKYQKFDSSGLRYTVATGGNTITVEVEVRR